MHDKLIDSCGRRIEYLRLSVTDRCDLRCRYCMPRDYRDFVAPAQWLTFDEMERLVRLFATIGVSRVRLTGGEPLTRGRLPELAARLARVDGVADLSLSTNATRLARHAAALAAAGVRRVNVSLDTLDAARFRQITGRDALDEVLGGLTAARAFGMSPIKVNMVVLPETADREIHAMVDFCMARGFVLRLIEPMPLGAGPAGPVDLQRVRARLRRRYALVDGVVPGGGPARYLQSSDGRFSLGFITPLSRHFCATCNRVRLTVDGDLYPCLGGDEERIALRPLLRGGASDQEVLDVLRAAAQHKPARHHFGESRRRLTRIMSRTGG